jgi:glycosyltransferase involved in cell wall biosynthesis
MSRRGGERTVEEMARLFPTAPIYTLFSDPRTLPPEFARKDIRVSPLGKLSPRFCDHRKLLPLYPWAARRLQAPAGTRLLLSSDASVTKGMRRPPGCLHVCYCHSPPRYIWDMSADYAKQTSSLGPVSRQVFRRIIPRLQAFDRAAAERVDHFIANSHFVAERIQRTYGRPAVVIPPPVQVDRFTPTDKPGDYYLVVSELVSYKRVDLAVDACRHLGRKLIVAGHGPEAEKLRARGGERVEFRGRVSDEEVATLMAGCRAFLHPQVEDFGIAAAEAQAAGRPVIAFRGGGARETVVEDETGLFFDEQTPESLTATLLRYEATAGNFRSENCRRQAERFSAAVFRRDLAKLLVELEPEVAGWIQA